MMKRFMLPILILAACDTQGVQEGFRSYPELDQYNWGTPDYVIEISDPCDAYGDMGVGGANCENRSLSVHFSIALGVVGDGGYAGILVLDPGDAAQTLYGAVGFSATVPTPEEYASEAILVVGTDWGTDAPNSPAYP